MGQGWEDQQSHRGPANQNLRDPHIGQSWSSATVSQPVKTPPQSHNVRSCFIYSLHSRTSAAQPARPSVFCEASSKSDQSAARNSTGGSVFPQRAKLPSTRRGSAEGLGCRPRMDVGIRWVISHFTSYPVDDYGFPPTNAVRAAPPARVVFTLHHSRKPLISQYPRFGTNPGFVNASAFQVSRSRGARCACVDRRYLGLDKGSLASPSLSGVASGHASARRSLHGRHLHPRR